MSDRTRKRLRRHPWDYQTAEQRRERQTLDRERLEAAGVCLACRRPGVVGGRVLCEACVSDFRVGADR